MQRASIILLLLFTGALKAQEEIEPVKVEAIRELLEITGAQANRQDLTQNFAQQLIAVLEANGLVMNADVQNMIREEVDLFIQQQLTDEVLQQKMYRIYARYFTLEELQGLIAFNKTDIGRKANKVMPTLMRESMSAAQDWSVEIGPALSARVKQRLEQEGIRLETRR